MNFGRDHAHEYRCHRAHALAHSLKFLPGLYSDTHTQMAQEVDQVVQAIVVASDPSQAALHQQALQFLSSIEANPSSAWKLGVDLFVDSNPDGTRRHPVQARFFGLRLLERFLDDRFEPLDNDSFQEIQKALVEYIQSEYVVGRAESSASCAFPNSIEQDTALIRVSIGSLTQQIFAYIDPLLSMHVPRPMANVLCRPIHPHQISASPIYIFSI